MYITSERLRRTTRSSGVTRTLKVPNRLGGQPRLQRKSPPSRISAVRLVSVHESLAGERKAFTVPVNRNPLHNRPIDVHKRIDAKARASESNRKTKPNKIGRHGLE